MAGPLWLIGDALNTRPMEVNTMLCHACCEEMRVVDSAGEGDPCWECPKCREVMDYERADEDPAWDGKDDGDYLQKTTA